MTDVICPQCRQPAVFLGTKIKVPPKSKPARWTALREDYYSVQRELERRAYAVQVRRRHDLEQRIRDLSALPANDGRMSLIKRLRSELEALGRDG